MARLSVAVAGDVMLDRYWFGPTQRVSPEAPVPVVRIDDIEERPGGGANVAVNLAALGVDTRLFGLAGADDAADRLQAMLTEQGIACTLRRVDGVPTVTKLRVLSRNQQLIRLDFEADADERLRGRLDASVGDALASAGAAILSDYGKGALSDVQAMIHACRDAGVPVLVDPKGTDFEKYRGATLITPNQSEFEAVAGQASSDEDLVARARRMMDDLDLDALLPAHRAVVGLHELLIGQAVQLSRESLGETSALLILLGGIYLVARNMMNWRIPVAVLGSGMVEAMIAAREASTVCMATKFRPR